MAFNLINFKKGTLAGLNTLKTRNEIEEGTFYLTIDTNKDTSRLYIGTGANTALPVNSNITTVTNKEDLTSSHAAPFNDGDFAYVTNGNILAVKIGDAWKQINTPPTEDDYKYLESVTYNLSVTNGVATIQWDGYRSDKDHVQGAFKVTGSNGITVSTTDGTAPDVDLLTISGDPATLSASAPTQAQQSTTISLSSTGNSASGSVVLAAGNNVQLTGTQDNITITATDTVNASLAITAGSGTGANQSTNGFTVAVTDTNDTVRGDIDPLITVLSNEAGTTTETYHFVNGTAALPVYTKDEINRRLNALDGMKYRGSVGSGGTYTSLSQITSPAVGDTFKLSSDIENIPVAGNTTANAKAGDLLIANSSATPAETGGVITSGLYFDIIPSGNDIQEYGFTQQEHGINLYDKAAEEAIGGIKLAAGTEMAVSDTWDSATHQQTITVNHATISSATNGKPTTGTAQNQEMGTAITINAVTGLTTENGHVTGVAVTPYVLKDTNLTLTSISSSATAPATGNNVGKLATVSTALAGQDGNNDPLNLTAAAVNFASDNLQVTAAAGTGGANDQVKMNFVWGQF